MLRFAQGLLAGIVFLFAYTATAQVCEMAGFYDMVEQYITGAGGVAGPLTLGGDVDLNTYDIHNSSSKTTDAAPDGSSMICGQHAYWNATAGTNATGGACGVGGGDGNNLVTCSANFGANSANDTLAISVTRAGATTTTTLTAKNGGAAGATQFNCQTSAASCCDALYDLIVANPIAGITVGQDLANAKVGIIPSTDTQMVGLVVTDSAGGAFATATEGLPGLTWHSRGFKFVIGGMSMEGIADSSLKLCNSDGTKCFRAYIGTNNVFNILKGDASAGGILSANQICENAACLSGSGYVLQTGSLYLNGYSKLYTENSNAGGNLLLYSAANAAGEGLALGTSATDAGGGNNSTLAYFTTNITAGVASSKYQILGGGMAYATPQTLNIADTGADVIKGTGTIGGSVAALSSVMLCACSDDDECTISMSETAAVSGMEMLIVAIGPHNCQFPDVAGVLETIGGAEADLDVNDNFRVAYIGSTWIQTAPVNDL